MALFLSYSPLSSALRRNSSASWVSSALNATISSSRLSSPSSSAMSMRVSSSSAISSNCSFFSSVSSSGRICLLTLLASSTLSQKPGASMRVCSSLSCARIASRLRDSAASCSCVLALCSADLYSSSWIMVWSPLWYIVYYRLPWQSLYFLPLPQGHRLLRPTLAGAFLVRDA